MAENKRRNKATFPTNEVLQPILGDSFTAYEQLETLPEDFMTVLQFKKTLK